MSDDGLDTAQYFGDFLRYETRLTNAGSATEAYINGSSSFLPIPELILDDADIFLVFLSAPNIHFLGPSTDDWFSARRPLKRIHEPNHLDEIPTYQFDEPVSVLGCTVQYQYCIPDKDICTALTNEPNARAAAENLWDSSARNDTFKVWSAAEFHLSSQVINILESMGTSLLTARNTLSNGLQGPLPPYQWQQEVLHWYQTSIAKLQRSVVELVTGPSDTSINKYVVKPIDGAEEQRECHSQEVYCLLIHGVSTFSSRSAEYTSFSVLGLAITLTLGSLIIALTFAAESIFKFVQRRRRKAKYQELEWISNETLQLQRMAHEELGMGNWTRATKTIPITGPEERLAILDVSDETHPTLTRPLPPEKPQSPSPAAPDHEASSTLRPSHSSTDATQDSQSHVPAQDDAQQPAVGNNAEHDASHSLADSSNVNLHAASQLNQQANETRATSMGQVDAAALALHTSPLGSGREASEI
ncbi:MAG: hypothetical protein Q9160_001315 [Pyrenula sp. 1 TL-2023]